MNLTVTDAAIYKISDLIAEENNPNLKLRMFVQGGGCSGFTYGFTLDEEQNDDDFVIPAGSLNILVDAISAQYLQDAEVDYIEELYGSQFKINNPTAVNTCGCGSSFSPF